MGYHTSSSTADYSSEPLKAITSSATAEQVFSDAFSSKQYSSLVLYRRDNYVTIIIINACKIFILYGINGGWAKYRAKYGKICGNAKKQNTGNFLAECGQL